MYYEDLNVWKRSANQACAVVQIISHCDNLTIKDQLTCTALAIPSNIAHGQNRRDKQQCLKYLNRAICGTAELATQLTIAHQIGFLDQQACKEILAENTIIGRMLGSLIKAKLHTHNESSSVQAQSNSATDEAAS